MKKILIVDDQEKIRQLVSVTLGGVGNYQIFQSTNGQQAVEVARKEKPDLIIMDIMMPGAIDGLEATRLLKTDPETKSSTIILLTAQGQRLDMDKGKAAGADDYFVKPFSPTALIRKVEEVLER